MKKFFVIMILFFTITLSGKAVNVAAADEQSLKAYITETIDGDKDLFSDLPPVVQKIVNSAIKLFKKAGTLSSNVASAVKNFQSLDETSENYNAELKAFFDQYNNMSLAERKITDLVLGLCDLKDVLVDTLNNSVVVDLYSTKKLDCSLTGAVTYEIGNETIAAVSDAGILRPLSMGFTSITATNNSGEQQIFRVVVKKPIIVRTVKTKVGETVTVPLPNGTVVVETHRSNKKAGYAINGNNVTITGIKESKKTYIYIGTADGVTQKFKVKVSK